MSSPGTERILFSEQTFTSANPLWTTRFVISAADLPKQFRPYRSFARAPATGRHAIHSPYATAPDRVRRNGGAERRRDAHGRPASRAFPGESLSGYAGPPQMSRPHQLCVPGAELPRSLVRDVRPCVEDPGAGQHTARNIHRVNVGRPVRHGCGQVPRPAAVIEHPLLVSQVRRDDLIGQYPPRLPIPRVLAPYIIIIEIMW